MSEVRLQLDNRRRGAFVLEEDGKKVGEMAVAISETALTAYHTEVDPAMEGKGLARKLLDEMVAYARKNHFKVVPLCVYVQAQFRRHPDEFEDIWKK
jgi:predicted GNAT family acetyltransferase